MAELEAERDSQRPIMEPGTIIEVVVHCKFDCGKSFQGGNSKIDMEIHAKTCELNLAYQESIKETCASAIQYSTFVQTNKKGKFKGSPSKHKRWRLMPTQQEKAEGMAVDTSSSLPASTEQLAELDNINMAVTPTVLGEPLEQVPLPVETPMPEVVIIANESGEPAGIFEKPLFVLGKSIQATNRHGNKTQLLDPFAVTLLASDTQKRVDLLS